MPALWIGAAAVAVAAAFALLVPGKGARKAAAPVTPAPVTSAAVTSAPAPAPALADKVPAAR